MSDSAFRALMREPDNETIAFLALKYGVDSATVVRVIDAYNERVDPLYWTSDSSGKGDSTTPLPSTYPYLPVGRVVSIVDSLSEVYRIAPQKLASLLGDYRLAQAAEEAGLRNP